MLEKEPLDYLSKKSQLYAIKHKGFWYSIDTVRDKKYLESLIKKLEKVDGIKTIERL